MRATRAGLSGAVRRPAAAGLLCLALILLGAAPAAAAPTWLAPVDLSLPGKNARDPRVAVDDAGGMVAIWEREGATPFQNTVQASIRSPGGAFSAPLDLSLPSQDPTLVMTPGGEAVVLWWHFQNPNYTLEASTRPPGGSFSPPVVVQSLPVGVFPTAIQAAINPSGALVVAWINRAEAELTEEQEEEEVNPDVNVVEASVRPAGGSFSEPEVVSPQPFEPGKNTSGPSVAIDPAGNSIVVMTYNDGDDVLIEAAIRPPGGGFQSPVTISEPGEDAFEPDIAVDAAGNAMAVWERFDGTDFVVQASQRPAGGEFAAPDDLSALGESSGFPRVAMTSAGEAIALWMRVEGEDTFVQASIRPPGGEFSAPDDLSPVQSPAFGGTAQLATNADGDALAVWSARGSGEQVVAASIRPAGGGFSSPIEISPTATVPLRPFGAIGKTGDAVAVWGRSNGAHDIVQAAGYDVDPPALGNLSIPATGTVGEPVSFSVTPFDVWPGVATSFSFGDGAGAPGAAVSHTYGAPGSYRVTATASDAVGSASESGVISISPSYEFRIGKHKRNRKRGTVLLTVHISGPGRVTVAGRLVKRRQRRRASAGPVRVPVIAKGRALKRLRKKGKARVRIRVSFRPDGGDHAATRRRLVVLIKKKPRKKRRAKNRRATKPRTR